MARSGHNAAFIATSDHYGALGTGCDRPGSSCPRALRLGSQRGPAPHRRDALPPARPPLANPSRSRGSNSNPAKQGAFPSPSAGTDVALHAVPTVPRVRLAREAQDFRPPPPLRKVPFRTNASRHRRRARGSSGEPETGASGAGHGGHAARPVPAGVTCPQGSRARAAANRRERCPGARRLW